MLTTITSNLVWRKYLVFKFMCVYICTPMMFRASCPFGLDMLSAVLLQLLLYKFMDINCM